MKTLRKLLIMALSCMLIVSTMLAIGCSKKGYELSAYDLQLTVGQKEKITLTPETDKAEWASSDEAIVTVDNEGNVEGISYGEANITVKIDDENLVCVVKVVSAQQPSAKFDFSLPQSVIGDDNKVQIFKAQSYALDLILKVGDQDKEIDLQNLTLKTSDDKIATVSIVDSQIMLKGIGKGSCEISATYVYEGNTLYSQTYNVVCDDDWLVELNKTELQLIADKTLSGQSISKNTTAQIKAYLNSTKQGINDQEMTAEQVTWSSDNESIATVDANGNILAKAGGNAIISAVTDYATVQVAVEVLSPIVCPADLDALALATYNKDKATAEQILANKYIFLNDIDYATHDRNYILPIASVNHEISRNANLEVVEEYDYIAYDNRGDFALGGLSRGSYYSLAWKDILELEEGSKDKENTNLTNYKYLKNSDNSEFRGINPNSLAFTGTINGNGYAIKNAFYMMDNLQGKPRNAGAGLASTGYGGVGGFFIGYNAGTIENLELYVTVADPSRFAYNNGKYQRICNQNSAAEQNSANTINGRYRGINMLRSDGGFEAYFKAGTGDVPLNNYNCHRSGEGTGTMGFVAINNGIIQNIYHKAEVFASYAEAVASAQGVLVGVNGGIIKDCVIDKKEYCTMAGETSLAIKTLAEGYGYNQEKDIALKFHAVGKIKGSQISGCYSLLERDSTSTNEEAFASMPTALTFNQSSIGKYAAINANNLNNFFAGVNSIDNLSMKVFTNCGETDKLDWNREYLTMFAEYEQDTNINKSIWNISKLENVVSIKINDGITVA